MGRKTFTLELVRFSNCLGNEALKIGVFSGREKYTCILWLRAVTTILSILPQITQPDSSALPPRQPPENCGLKRCFLQPLFSAAPEGPCCTLPLAPLDTFYDQEPRQRQGLTCARKAACPSSSWNGVPQGPRLAQDPGLRALSCEAPFPNPQLGC